MRRGGNGRLLPSRHFAECLWQYEQADAHDQPLLGGDEAAAVRLEQLQLCQLGSFVLRLALWLARGAACLVRERGREGGARVHQTQSRWLFDLIWLFLCVSLKRGAAGRAVLV